MHHFWTLFPENLQWGLAGNEALPGILFSFTADLPEILKCVWKIDAWMYLCINAWIYECMDACINGYTDPTVHGCIHAHGTMDACMADGERGRGARAKREWVLRSTPDFFKGCNLHSSIVAQPHVTLRFRILDMYLQGNTTSIRHCYSMIWNLRI